MARQFAFLMHPLRFDDFARKYPFTQRLPERWVESLFRHVPPMRVGHVTGVVSPTGAELEGWLLALAMTPRVLLETPYPVVLRALEKAGRLAESLGAEILGLGAFTKIAGDRGVTLASRLNIPVTSGNSYTTATAVAGALAAARRLGVEVATAHVVVIGATGSIGAACCHLLAREVAEITVVARGRERLEELAATLGAAHPGLVVHVETNIPVAARAADILIAVSSSPDALVEPEDLKPGAVVCDVARPRNLSRIVSERRPDVLVIDGGVIQVPGARADLGFDFGFPPRMVEACMAETMVLALDGRLENFTLGPSVDPIKVGEIQAIADRHGFKMSGFRRFERAIPDAEVEQIRERAQARLGAPAAAAAAGESL